MTIAKREALPTANPGRDYQRGEDWRADAACKGKVDDWMWHDHGSRHEAEALTEARRVCGSCPVVSACLEFALADLSLDGIWAGTNLAARRRIVRNRARKSRAKTEGQTA